MSGAGVTGDKATPAKLGLREPKLRSLQAEMIAEEARKCSRKNEGVRILDVASIAPPGHSGWKGWTAGRDETVGMILNIPQNR